MDAAHFEKMLTSEVLFEGRVVTLTKDTALLENGKTATREVASVVCAAKICAAMPEIFFVPFNARSIYQSLAES